MHYNLEIIEEPDSLDLVEELKEHIDSNNGSADDSKLADFLDAAMSAFEHETQGRIVLPTTFRQHFPCWSKYLELARWKVTSVESVTYVDENEAEQTVAEEDWQADLTGAPALVYLPDGNYPALSATRPRPIAVTFVCGWPDVEYLPKDVRVAILQLAAHLYAHRESHTDENLTALPLGFGRCCDKYRTGLGGV